MLKAVDLCKRYSDGTLALDSLNLKVEPGEIYCILGAPKAGKSTVLQLFLGFLRPTSGRALVQGVDVVQKPRETLRQMSYLRAGAVFYEDLTALENLAFFARLGGRGILDREVLTMALREVGLPERVFTDRVSRFNQGMRQKLGFAVTLIKEAPILLLDEPTGGLDPKTQNELIVTIAGLREKGKAILLTTESPFEAKQLADRLSVLKEGRQVLRMTRQELQYQDLESLYFDYVGGLTKTS